MTMRLALFEPDIPQNAGALIRLAPAWGAVDIIEPCGSVRATRAFRRAGMDYLDAAPGHAACLLGGVSRRQRTGGGLVLLTTESGDPYTDFAFGRTTRCCSAAKARACRTRCTRRPMRGCAIPLRPGLRSLNVAQAGAMVLGEALRQTKGFPA